VKKRPEGVFFILGLSMPHQSSPCLSSLPKSAESAFIYLSVYQGRDCSRNPAKHREKAPAAGPHKPGGYFDILVSPFRPCHFEIRSWHWI